MQKPSSDACKTTNVQITIYLYLHIDVEEEDGDSLPVERKNMTIDFAPWIPKWRPQKNHGNLKKGFGDIYELEARNLRW